MFALACNHRLHHDYNPMQRTDPSQTLPAMAPWKKWPGLKALAALTFLWQLLHSPTNTGAVCCVLHLWLILTLALTHNRPQFQELQVLKILTALTLLWLFLHSLTNTGILLFVLHLWLSFTLALTLTRTQV